jgi:hypothetical protein
VVLAYRYEPSGAVYSTEACGCPFSIDKTSVYFPEHVFPYIQAQTGVFTIHHRRPKDDRFVPLEETEHADLLLSKVEIPAGCFPTMAHGLWRLGVHPASLFPGLRGLVERIAYQNEPRPDEFEERAYRGWLLDLIEGMSDREFERHRRELFEIADPDNGTGWRGFFA